MKENNLNIFLSISKKYKIQINLTKDKEILERNHFEMECVKAFVS